MNQDRPLIRRIREWLQPPDVIPIKKSWSVTFWWVVRLGLIWILRGC